MNKRNQYLSLISAAGIRKSVSIFGHRLYYGAKPATKAEIRIKHMLVEWIGRRQYWDNSISMEFLALKADVQKEEITAFMKRYTSSKLLTVRKELRLEDAQQLLLENMDTPAATIGKMVGIMDKSDFRKQFRDTFGLNPNEWRNANS